MLKLYWRLVFHPYLIRIIAITATIFLTSTLDVLSIGMIVPVVSIMIAPEESSSTWIADMVQNVTNKSHGEEHTKGKSGSQKRVNAMLA